MCVHLVGFVHFVHVNAHNAVVHHPFELLGRRSNGQEGQMRPKWDPSLTRVKLDSNVQVENVCLEMKMGPK